MFLCTSINGCQTHMFLQMQTNPWNSKAACRTPLWTPATNVWLHTHTHIHTHHNTQLLTYCTQTQKNVKINISWSLSALINGVNHLQTTNPDYSITLCVHANLNSARLAVSFPPQVHQNKTASTHKYISLRPRWPITHTTTETINNSIGSV